MVVALEEMGARAHFSFLYSNGIETEPVHSIFVIEPVFIGIRIRGRRNDHSYRFVETRGIECQGISLKDCGRHEGISPFMENVSDASSGTKKPCENILGGNSLLYGGITGVAFLVGDTDNDTRKSQPKYVSMDKMHRTKGVRQCGKSILNLAAEPVS